MTRSTVIANPYRNMMKIIRENNSAVVSGLIVMIGIITGSVLYAVCSEDLNGELLEAFISYTVDFSHKNKPEIFSGLILPDVVYIVVMVILGTCAFGTPAVISMSAVYSMGLGVLVAYIFDNFALKGIEYCLLVFLPGKFLLILSMLLLTQNCIVVSKSIRQNLCEKTINNGRVVDLKKYNTRNIVIFIVLILSDVIDFLTLISFSGLFEFA